MTKKSENTEKIDNEFKGFPFSENPLTLKEISKQGWGILQGNLPMPVATLKSSIIKSNSRWMRFFTKRFGVRIAPHGKTSMSPQLFQIQMNDGAWAITVANVHQLRLCREWNIKRVFMANQVAGTQNLLELTRELSIDPELDLYMLVDSIENAKQIASAAKDRKLVNPIQVLVELGFEGGRTGCRSLKSAINLARAIKSLEPQLILRGVEGYEALLRSYTNPENRIINFLIEIKKLVNQCICENLFSEQTVIISAGGSDFFDIVLKELSKISTEKEVVCVIRSGCYLTHDSLNYNRFFKKIMKRTKEAKEIRPLLQPALQIWGVIQSIPEKRLCIVNIGKRDISYDIEMPVPELFFRPGIDKIPKKISKKCKVIDLNDQHAYLDISDINNLNVGDLLAFGISHPCTTFDKWRLIYLVDDSYNVIGGIRTYLA